MTPRVASGTQGVEIDVHVQPRAVADSVGGVHGGALRVRVRAAPEAGEANAAVCTALARAFGVRKDAVALRSGGKSRRKRVRIEGDAQALLVRLAALEQDGPGV